jgi:chromosome segregation ATPase
MQTFGPTAVFVTSILVMGGCATSDCDPTRGGFIRGIGCSVSGSYGAREANLRTTRDAAEIERDRSQRALDKTHRQKQATEERVAAAGREYQALDRDLAAMQTKLSRAKSGNEDLKRKLRGLQQEMKLLKADLFTPQAEKDKQLGDLRKRKADLERQIEGAL